MTPRELAKAGLYLIKQAIIEHLTANPLGCGNSQIARALGIESNFEGKSVNYLSYSVLGLLLKEKKVHYVGSGSNRRFFVGPKT